MKGRGATEGDQRRGSRRKRRRREERGEEKKGRGERTERRGRAQADFLFLFLK